MNIHKTEIFNNSQASRVLLNSVQFQFQKGTVPNYIL